MKENNFKKKDFLILFFILIIAFILRLYKINSPLADLHSWRQVDTAAVARNYVKNGVDLLKSMLQYDPARRITAKDAMEHPYFTANTQ